MYYTRYFSGQFEGSFIRVNLCDWLIFFYVITVTNQPGSNFYFRYGFARAGHYHFKHGMYYLTGCLAFSNRADKIFFCRISAVLLEPEAGLALGLREITSRFTFR